MTARKDVLRHVTVEFKFFLIQLVVSYDATLLPAPAQTLFLVTFQVAVLFFVVLRVNYPHIQDILS